MTDSLRIAFVHFAPEHGNKEKNLETLLALNAGAAEKGARILLNTELACSGYTFRNRQEVGSVTEEIPGSTTDAFAALARNYGAYVAFGMPETTALTRMYYNSGVMLDPAGNLALRYRKINTEIRWACPGSPYQKNVVRTPWGRIGLLVCSDAYHSLIPRVTALRGADLVLVPANWPTSGLDPRRIWRARARENGFYLAVCNRGGYEPHLDARNSHSGLYTPEGEVLMENSVPESGVFLCDLPLKHGRIRPGGVRKLKRKRRPELYHDVYLDLRSVRDLTSFYELPEPGPVTFAAVPVPGSLDRSELLEMVHRKLGEVSGKVEVAVLPGALLRSSRLSETSEMFDRFEEMAGEFNMMICWGHEETLSDGVLRYVNKVRPGAKTESRRDSHFIKDVRRSPGSLLPDLTDNGAARIGVGSVDEFLQPEVSICLSKLGADFLLGCGNGFDAGDFDILATRAFDYTHFAAAGWNWAFVALPPVEHTTWRTVLEKERPIVETLDTSQVRVKRFQDRLDVGRLLEP
ncbi:MAG: carbon-nitrogen hydrolase family protein [Deltaproteobacteria bacterium]|nr:carbon-nitrogen hydrolase family protein [Deltaproteobacteria bacterium]